MSRLARAHTHRRMHQSRSSLTTPFRAMAHATTTSVRRGHARPWSALGNHLHAYGGYRARLAVANRRFSGGHPMSRASAAAPTAATPRSRCARSGDTSDRNLRFTARLCGGMSGCLPGFPPGGHKLRRVFPTPTLLRTRTVRAGTRCERVRGPTGRAAAYVLLTSRRRTWKGPPPASSRFAPKIQTLVEVRPGQGTAGDSDSAGLEHGCKEERKTTRLSYMHNLRITTHHTCSLRPDKVCCPGPRFHYSANFHPKPSLNNISNSAASPSAHGRC